MYTYIYIYICRHDEGTWGRDVQLYMWCDGFVGSGRCPARWGMRPGTAACRPGEANWGSPSRSPSGCLRIVLFLACCLRVPFGEVFRRPPPPHPQVP